LVVTTRNQEIVNREEISLLPLPWCRRIEILIQHKVDTILCGGIRRCDFFLLHNTGINVQAGLTGEVDTVLRSFLTEGPVGVGFNGVTAFHRPGWFGSGGARTGFNRRGRGKNNKSRR